MPLFQHVEKPRTLKAEPINLYQNIISVLCMVQYAPSEPIVSRLNKTGSGFPGLEIDLEPSRQNG